MKDGEDLHPDAVPGEDGGTFPPADGRGPADVIEFLHRGSEFAIEESNGIKREILRRASPSSTTVVATTHWPDKNSAQGQGATRTSSGMASVSRPDLVSFNRQELDLILRVYGFKVADGEWKDYAIDMLKDRAVFSVFRRANDVPLYCIEKDPKLARRQGQWSVIGSGGQVLKRGHDLARVLQVLEKKPRLRVV
jgi:hypothetical protein